MTLDVLSLTTNAVFFVLSALALISAISVFVVARANDRAKDRELSRYQADAAARIEEAKGKAESAQRDVSLANARAAALEKEAAEAKERTVQIQLALEQEVSRRSPRTILPEQVTRFTTALNGIAKGKIAVMNKQFDEESERYAEQLTDILKTAGFDVSRPRGPMAFGATGQWMMVPNQSWLEKPTAAGDIQKALNSSLGLPFPGYVRSDDYPNIGDILLIVVAAKTL